MSDMVKLLKKAQQGDEESMIKLLSQFDSLIVKLSKRNSKVLDEDCYQELSVQFVTAVNKFNLEKYSS